MAEDPSFTPYASRLSHPPFANEPLALRPVIDGTTPPDGIPTELEGLPLVGILESPASTTAAYATVLGPSTRPSQFLESGGILLNRYASNGDSIADDLRADRDIGDRVSIVDVGPYRAAVTWADPDERGVRVHHVLWTEGYEEVDVYAVHEAELLVAATRQWVCSTR